MISIDEMDSLKEMPLQSLRLILSGIDEEIKKREESIETAKEQILLIAASVDIEVRFVEKNTQSVDEPEPAIAETFVDNHLSLLPENSQKTKLQEKKKRNYKYRNPENELEVWTGEGVQPKWIKDLVSSGKDLNDLLE